MTFRIGWLSPLTPASGVGTFSQAVTNRFPASFGGEAIDVTLLHPGHRKLYKSRHRTIQIEESENFHQILSLFDLLVYNVGNNREHHEAIFNLLRTHPGVVICHDYVYQHYLAERSLRSGNGFASYAALLTKYGGHEAEAYIKRSRITSRTGQIRYSPWDSECSAAQPMSDAIHDLGSALVVHSRYTRQYAERRFEGPIVQLGMPFDQKSCGDAETYRAWQRQLIVKQTFHLVSFGFIQSTKCIDLVLGAIGSSDTLRRRIRYTIAGYAGDGDYLRRLREMVVALGIQDVVVFEVDVSEARLADLASDADVFVNLRKPNTEGSSASLVEQLVTGKPVVVLNSGCYAEIPRGAAVVLSADAGSADIHDALQMLLGKPELMLAIGYAGREYARSWTCASYAEELVRFIFTNRDLLQERSEAVGLGPWPSRYPVHEDAWSKNVASARASLRYLDNNMLALDPAIVSTKTPDELCGYVAHVIFGVFGNTRLLRALGRFFAGRDGHAAYWACVTFALISDAVFGNEAAAQQRVKIMGPRFDPEFWSVIEHFPTRYLVIAGSLVLLGKMPDPGDPRLLQVNDSSRAEKRLHLAEFLWASSASEETSGPLRSWLEQTSSPDVHSELPTLDEDLNCEVGNNSFRQGADLSGFYDIEPDHAWTRGTRGFVGLRLGGDIGRIDLLVRHVDASPSHPCEIVLGNGREEARVEVRSPEPIWIGLDRMPEVEPSTSTTWFRLSTNRACRPAGSADTRILGVGVMRLHLRTRPFRVNRVSPRSERVASMETAA